MARLIATLPGKGKKPPNRYQDNFVLFRRSGMRQDWNLTGRECAMSLHDLVAAGWAKLIMVWDYPIPLGVIFLPIIVAILLPVIGYALSTGSDVILRHRKVH